MVRSNFHFKKSWYAVAAVAGVGVVGVKKTGFFGGQIEKFVRQDLKQGGNPKKPQNGSGTEEVRHLNNCTGNVERSDS